MPRMKTRPHQLSTIEAGDLTIAGYSVAGEESVVLVPELDVAFDIGRCPSEALSVNNVFITHGHTDHTIGLLYYFAQRDFQGIDPGRAIVPPYMVEPLEKLMTTWGQIDGKTPPHQIVGLQPGDDFEIRRNLLARSFPTKHSRSSMGFSIIDVRRKLKDEYLGLEGPQIVELKNKGVEITDVSEVPLVCYIGDTMPGNFSSLPYVRDARVLLVECTFFDDDHRSRARDGRHVHVDQLEQVLDGMNNQLVIITHLTRRTPMALARRKLKKILPDSLLSKVTFLMSREHISQE